MNNEHPNTDPNDDPNNSSQNRSGDDFHDDRGARSLKTPDWPRDAVFYHIFLDRFANGDTANDPQRVQPWGSSPTYTNFMGGDLAGVMDHMDYLRDLGVSALYLSPVFASNSNHGYDTSDYHKIDPRLGTTDTLKDLVQRAHTLGWHILLDAVFNHTSIHFWAFEDLRAKGEVSAYRDWYFPKDFPVKVHQGSANYDTWNGFASLPKLNVENPEARRYLMEVATRWIHNTQIDGWRLDVPNEIPPDFWKEFRQKVKAANPEAFIVGEIWDNAQQWLQGDTFDSVMNYPWRGTVLDFLAAGKIPADECEARLAQQRSDYPAAATHVMFNILGSHDTERLRTMCGGDVYRERQCVLIQMTYPGTPCIYYGDEIGLEGGKDPDNRQAMVWEPAERDNDMLAFYTHLLAVRRDHIALRRGDYQTVWADHDHNVLAYARRYEHECVLVAVNGSDQPQHVALSRDALGGDTFHTWLDSGAHLDEEGNAVCLSLPPRGMALYGTT